MIETLKNKTVWHKTENLLLVVKNDYENGELLFSNGVLGRDEDVLPTDFIVSLIQQNPQLFDEFNSLIEDDAKFNYTEDEFIEWIYDCVYEEEVWLNENN